MNKLFYGDKFQLTSMLSPFIPTTPMIREAAAVGRFEDGFGRTYPRLQIITLAELFQGKKPDIPFVDPASVKRAKREEMGRQDQLL